MTGYLPDERVDDVEDLTPDDTIGVLWFDEPEQFGDGALVDVGRLRQALVSFDKEIGNDEVFVEVVELENGVETVLLRESPTNAGAIALAGKDDREEIDDEMPAFPDGGQIDIADDDSSAENSEHKPVSEWGWITRKCTGCGEKVLQPAHDTSPTFHDCAPDHPQMVPVYGDEAIETDGGLPPTFAELATSTELECIGCGDVVDDRWIYNGRCPGCRHGPSASAAAAQGEPVTDGGTASSDDVGYLVSSRYRTAVLAHLADGAATPGTLAEETGYGIAHISRALDGLRDRGLVELIVEEDRRKGRLYDLTERGRSVIEDNRNTINRETGYPSKTVLEDDPEVDAYAHLQEIISHMTAIDWSDVPGIGADEAAAIASRFENSRNELEGSL